MSGIISQIKENDIEIKVKLGPIIDEHSDLSPIQLEGVQVVNFDLSELIHLNSTGIKRWMDWQKTAKSANPNLFYNFLMCPKIFIDQANMVDGFLPKNSKVYSLAVPFYCEKCDKESTQSYTVGKEYQYTEKGWKLNHPDLTCSEKDCEFEPDVADRYFQFLRRMKT